MSFQRHYILSGYFSACDKIKDSVYRFFKNNCHILFVLKFYIIIPYISYRINDINKNIEEKAFGAVEVVLNHLILPDYLKDLSYFYLWAYLPFLTG